MTAPPFHALASHGPPRPAQSCPSTPIYCLSDLRVADNRSAR